jgi:hypothetical protein
MHQSNSKISIAALLLLFSFCKDPVIKDSGLVPENKLGIITTDTLTLITETVFEDSLRTDELAVNIIGKMDDPVFGKSVASASFQLRIQTDNYDFGKGVQLDSAVLMLRYAGSYGNTKTPMTFIVRELDESMNKDTQYYSNKTFAVKSGEIGRLSNNVPNFTDTVNTVDGKYFPHIRIKIDQTWANDIIADTAKLKNNTLFLPKMKGIQVSVDENASGNSMIYFDLYSITALKFYYKNDEKDSLVFEIAVDNNSATSNCFKHDYSRSVVKQYMENKKLNTGDSIVFIQSMAGVKTKVNVPHLKNLGNISISKAELIITGLKEPFEINSEYPVPGRLVLNASDSLGKNDFIDDQFVSDSYFGGNAVQESNIFGNTVNRYKFNTALHYQNIAKNAKPDYGVYILTFPSSRIADRLIAGGGSHSKNPMKLKLTYTKIE